MQILFFLWGYCLKVSEEREERREERGVRREREGDRRRGSMYTDCGGMVGQFFYGGGIEPSSAWCDVHAMMYIHHPISTHPNRYRREPRILLLCWVRQQLHINTSSQFGTTDTSTLFTTPYPLHPKSHSYPCTPRATTFSRTCFSSMLA